MIKIDVKMPRTADLVRAAMAEVENQITKTARSAAARHGGVTVRFTRKPDGTVKSVEFTGSQAAIEAAQAAISK